ncbi:hypothetical protein N7494_000508 [Penicillium frequentans]|uniref:Uncharacterized protein n=1 Tax=Penicillium frequentans TaxID=3151616 RepID=A0AAD6GLF1_9EURO|nr:hypothetical protein N7494_000508 [Penicillium glabrum]
MKLGLATLKESLTTAKAHVPPGATDVKTQPHRRPELGPVNAIETTSKQLRTPEDVWRQRMWVEMFPRAQHQGNLLQLASSRNPASESCTDPALCQ